MRDLYPDELKSIRDLIGQLVLAEKREDILGRFSKRQLAFMSIPLIMWGQGHELV